MNLASVNFCPQCFLFGTQKKPTQHFSIKFVLSSKISNLSWSRDLKRVYHLTPTKSFYMKKLGRCYEEGNYDESLIVLERMVGDGHDPDAIFCSNLIKEFFDSNLVEKVVKVMEILESRGEPIFAYTGVVSGLCKSDRIEAAMLVLNRMRNLEIMPDVVMYNALIETFSSVGRFDVALELFDQMLDADFLPDVLTNKILIAASVVNGWINEAMKLFDEMWSRGLQPDVSTCGILVQGLSQDGESCEALKVFDKMLSIGLNPDVATFGILIEALCLDGKINEAMVVFDAMLSKNLCPATNTSSLLMQVLCWDAKMDEMTIYVKLEEIGCRTNEITCNLLVHLLCKEKFLDEGFALLQDMQRKGIKAKVTTYNKMILALSRANRLIDAIELLMEMVENGCKPTPTNYAILLNGIRFTGMREEAVELANILFGMGVINKKLLQELLNQKTRALVHRVHKKS